MFFIAASSAMSVFPDAVGVHTSSDCPFSRPCFIAFSWHGLSSVISFDRMSNSLSGIFFCSSEKFIFVSGFVLSSLMVFLFL